MENKQTTNNQYSAHCERCGEMSSLLENEVHIGLCSKCRKVSKNGK